MNFSSAYSVLAHAGEFHGQPAPDSEQTPQATDSTPAISAPSASSETNAIVEQEVSAPPPVGQVPDGLGESLFTMLIGFPWLLMALRTRFLTRPE